MLIAYIPEQVVERLHQLCDSWFEMHDLQPTITAEASASIFELIVTCTWGRPLSEQACHNFKWLLKRPLEDANAASMVNIDSATIGVTNIEAFMTHTHLKTIEDKLNACR